MLLQLIAEGVCLQLCSVWVPDSFFFTGKGSNRFESIQRRLKPFNDRYGFDGSDISSSHRMQFLHIGHVAKTCPVFAQPGNGYWLPGFAVHRLGKGRGK